MPPKKKRGGQNQVTFATAKMSTRSTKKANIKSEKSDRNPKMVKTGAKKGKTVAKSRAKKAAPKKKKSGVMSTQPPTENTLETVLLDLEGGDDDDECKMHPIEAVFVKGDTEPDEFIDLTDGDNVENEECEIVEQLENLTVVSEEPISSDIIEQPEVVECVVESENVEEQVIEIDNFEGLPVEYITEEFVPVAENTEIIIEENTESDLTEEKPPLETSKIEDTPPPAEDEIPQPPAEEPTKPEDDLKDEIKGEEEEEKPKPEPAEESEIKPPEKPKPKKKAPPKKDASKKPQSKKKPKPKPKKEPNLDKFEDLRRSSRIKSINTQKQRSKGHGVVKSTKSPETDSVVATESSNSIPEIEKSMDSISLSSSTTNENDNKPVKVKSRWRRSSELEMNVLTPAAVVMETSGDSEKIAEANAEKQKLLDEQEVEARLKQFVHLKENLYLTDRMTCKEAKKMTCDCFLTSEEIEKGEMGCGEDCLNRLLMIECGSVCPIGDRCTNKKFQKTQFAPVEVFKTEKKGLGLRAAANIPYGEFILEYVGEVLDHEEFDNRADEYSNDKNRHYYFMSLRADAIIDATMKGNISRFINHSCDPNAETQKWTVNGELRIGFFSTRTILAGEEITFDYRFQRYGKEAQKCYCEAQTCRGWLGEEPDDEDDEDEEEEDEEEEEEVEDEQIKEEVAASKDVGADVEQTEAEVAEPKSEETGVEVEKTPTKKERKKRSPRKKPRKDIFEDLDQLDEEIEMLVTTGLKNQAHTLKLSRLMVRAKEPAQRTKLLRILRRGELPCRRLFLDYHGLRLMHGYMTDAQHLAKTDGKYESLRLEMLQTLATLPIPNKTMLQDSKVLPTVEKWSNNNKDDDLPIDSDSSSPQTDPPQTPTEEDKSEQKENKENKEAKLEETEIRKSTGMDYQGSVESGSFSNTHGKELADEISDIFQEDLEISSTEDKSSKQEPEIKQEERNYEEEITALALKLLEEWSNLKEVFKIPKKERIEQMKEHEREANRGYIAGLGLEQDAEKKNESRYRILKRYRSIDKVDSNRKNIKLEDRNLTYPKMGKFERRKMFALQVEQREEERRRKQREMWRQHEQHCILLGTDPRLTAPFDPNRGYQCIWNPQIGQWQNYPIQNPNMIFNPQTPMNLQAASNPAAAFPFIHPQGMIPASPINPMHPLPTLPYQEEAKKEEDYSQVKFMGPIPPPAKLPPKWKCAKDKYGRPYYYHVKIRKSQWEPPPFSQPQEDPDESSETTSSSDTSSLSSDTSSDESESEEEADDSKLMMEVRRHMEKQAKSTPPKPVPAYLKKEEEKEDTPSPIFEERGDDKDDNRSDIGEPEEEEAEDAENENSTSVDARLKDLFSEEKQPSSKKRRVGLVSEIIISPRTEEDRLQFREDLKRYKLNKEKLKKEKEMILQQSKKHTKEKRNKTTIKLKMKEMADSNSETAKRIKEAFRSSMATVVVSVLNAYRKPDCKEGRITNTDDFKHLARKLTHFVMLKEMKHIEKIEDLVCTENVKGKAKEYIRKYMSKFGENYQKRHDEPDF